MSRVPGAAVQELASRIADLPEVDRPRRPAEVVRELAPEIRAALERNQSIEAIVEMLAGAGVRLSPKTVRNYLRKAERASAPEPAGTATSVPPRQPTISTPLPSERPKALAASPKTPADRGHFRVREDSSDL